MSEKQYIMVLNQGLRINTYRSENLKSLIDDAIEEIFESYHLNTHEITSNDFDFQDFLDLYDLNRFEANALKKLVEFKETLSNTNIQLDGNSNYQFSEPNNKWSLKFEERYGHTFVSGFTIVDKVYPISFHIEEI